MAKKEEKKVKKPAKVKEKTPVKQEKPAPKAQPVKAEPKRETTTIKKPTATRETKTIKVPAQEAKPKKPSILSRPKKVKEAKFEEKKDLDKLYVYFTIVNAGVADSVVKVFEEMGCSVSFIQNGKGTANEEVIKALHITDIKKEVVISIIRESRLEDIDKELAALFAASRRSKGIAFATRMDAIQGVRLYKFLSQTL